MRIVITAALVLALVSAGAASAGDKVTVSLRLEMVFPELLIALEEGFFEAQGLEVQVVPWHGADAMLPALATGRLDFAPTSSLSPSYINVIQRGAPIRLVAARTVHAVGACGYVAFLARTALIESGRLEGLASLKGLRVATDRTEPSYYYWSRLLERAGLTVDDVVLKNVPDEIKVEALARDLVDVISTLEPKITRIVDSGHGKVWLPVSAATPDRQNTFLLFGDRLLHERRDLGHRVMAAYRAGLAQYLEGKTERNVEILAKRTRLDPDEVRKLCWPTVSRDGRIDPAGLADYQEWARGLGLIDAVLPYSALVDDGFLERATPASPTP